jgi:hypothetical protein
MLNFPSTSEMVVAPSAAVIVAKASGLFAVDSLQFRLAEIEPELK